MTPRVLTFHFLFCSCSYRKRIDIIVIKKKSSLVHRTIKTVSSLIYESSNGFFSMILSQPKYIESKTVATCNIQPSHYWYYATLQQFSSNFFCITKIVLGLGITFNQTQKPSPTFTNTLGCLVMMMF